MSHCGFPSLLRVSFKTTTKNHPKLPRKSKATLKKTDVGFFPFLQWGVNQSRLFFKLLIFHFLWIDMHTCSQKHKFILPKTLVVLFRHLISKDNKIQIFKCIC